MDLKNFEKVVDAVSQSVIRIIQHLCFIVLVVYTLLLPVLWYGVFYVVNLLAEGAGREPGGGMPVMVFVCLLMSWLFLLACCPTPSSKSR